MSGPRRSLGRREFLAVGLAGPLVSTGERLDDARSSLVPDASLRWHYDGTNGRQSRPPIATDESVYLTSVPGDVYALSRETGAEQWQFSTEGMAAIVAPNTVDREVVCAADSEGTVYGIDRETGRERWRFADNDAGDSVEVVVADGTAYVAGTHVTAISLADGSERWSMTPEGTTIVEPLVVDDTVYVGTWRDAVFALATDDGRVRWEFNRTYDRSADAELYPARASTGVRSAAMPPGRGVELDGTIVVWDWIRYRLSGVAVADGSERWHHEFDGGTQLFTGVVTDAAYVQRGNALVAVSRATGEERWRFVAEDRLYRWPVAGDDAVYVSDFSAVYAVDAADGSVRWRVPLDGEDGAWFGAPRDDEIVFDDNEGTIRAVSPADGSVRWTFEHGGRASRWPEVTDDAIFASFDREGAYALERPPENASTALRRSIAGAGPELFAGGLLAVALAEGGRRVGEKVADLTPTTSGDFEVLEALGDGPTGTVSRACTPDVEVVALKRFEGASSDDLVRALETWAGLDHEGVLPVRDWGTDPVPWLATAYAEGGNLADHLDDLNRREGIGVVSTVAEVVHRVHRDGVGHGRLHPGNVLVSSANRDEVLVGDWLGAATRAGLPRGYAAPEGEGVTAPEGEGVDPVAVDVFQLGALATHVLTGEPPAGGEPKFDADVPEDLADVLATALASDPGERYDSALQFRDMLRWSALRD